MTSSLSARVGLLLTVIPSGGSTMLLGATAPLSRLRYIGPVPKGVPSLLVGFWGSWLISSPYGSKSSLLGLNRLPLPSTSEMNPVAEPLVQLAEKGQFGPQAR